MRDYKMNYEPKNFGMDREKIMPVKRLYTDDIIETKFKDTHLLLERSNECQNKMYSYSKKIEGLDDLKL